MKEAIKRFLRQKGIYEYLRYSRLFRLYQQLAKPADRVQEQRELTFYRSFLPGSSALFFDIGANDGHKTEAFLRLTRHVVACEPDPGSFRTLRIRFRSRNRKVTLVQKALGATTGEAELLVHHPGSAFNTLNPQFGSLLESDRQQRWNEEIRFAGTTRVEVTTLDTLISAYGRPHFIKIDVEGYELQVLRGLSEAIPFISLECLFPEFREELSKSRDHLRRLDPLLRYNIARAERLLYDHWLSDQELDHCLQFWTEPHFELIVQMPSACKS